MKTKISIQKVAQFVTAGFQFIGVLFSYIWEFYLKNAFAKASTESV
jgi:hypothetical protein